MKDWNCTPPPPPPIQVTSMRKRYVGIVASLVVLLVAPASTAATYQFFHDTKYYASEAVAGANADVGWGSDRHSVLLGIQLTPSEVRAIDQGDELDVTFSLVNADFARKVRISDVNTSVVFDALSAGSLRVAEVEGGERGEDSVTFKLEATEADWDTMRFVVIINVIFFLPDLTGLVPDPATGSFKPVSLNLKTEAGGGSGWIDTSSPSFSTLEPCDGLRPCLSVNDQGVVRRLRPTTGDEPRQPWALASFQDAIEFRTSFASAPARIDLATGRVGFVSTQQSPTIGEVEVGLANAGDCGGNTNPCLLQSNGTRFTLARRGDGRGSLNVSVEGDFRPGDDVWLDLDQDGEASANEALTLDGSFMRGSFTLDTVVGNPNAAQGANGDFDREHGLRTSALRYSPNGSDPLRSGTLRSTFSVEMARDGAPGKPQQIGEFTMTYAGIAAERTVQGIAPLDSSEVSNLRIKCESSVPCTVYLECDDGDGETWFAQLADPVANRATLRLSSADLAQALGMDDVGWSGRLSCAVLSQRDVAVQVLARSENVLTNQTYVDTMR